MCRMFGVVASQPADVSHEILHAENSILRQSEAHDSGWGIANYLDRVPEIKRFPVAAYVDHGFDLASHVRARLMMVHVRRATIGDLSFENTHPFSRGPYAYCHNGTIMQASLLAERADRQPIGDTDSERFFELLMTGFDDHDVIGSLRGAVERTCDLCRFSALNFFFSDGRKFYAYRFGVYRLFHLERVLEGGGRLLMISSERIGADRPWIELDQDTLLTADPAALSEAVCMPLLGDRAREVDFVPLDAGTLRGAARGEWAAQRAKAGF